MDFLGSVAAFMREGGPFMWPILGVAVLIAAIAVERAIVILDAGRVDAKKLGERIATALRKNQPAEARALVARGSNPLIAVARALLERPVAGLDRSAAEEELTAAYEAEASVAMAPLHHRLAYLGMLANVATLLGLLGTIFGLIHAFRGVGLADPAHRSAFLAAGISEALNTTAFGLLVAIPALALHAFLFGQVDGLADRVEAAAQRWIRLLAAGESRGELSGAASGAGRRSPLQLIEEVKSASVAVR